MPILDRPALGLEALADFVAADPGLAANIYQSDIDAGVAAARDMNEIYAVSIAATGVNADGVISPEDMHVISDYIRANATLYQEFLIGHGDDEGNEETGFHLVQNDGGAYRFQGRDFIDTVADAIYHVGFDIVDGRFQNEDGDQNERVADVAGWVNYFLNGENIVWGGAENDKLHSGSYSFALDAAADEIFRAGGGNDRVSAGAGADIVFAGDGDDSVDGGSGDDHLMGEDGADHVWGAEGDDLIEGGLGDDDLGGGAGNDKLRGEDGHDRVFGDEGDDILDGGAGNDELGGEDGNDTAYGGIGDDKLWGQAGNDRLFGQDGDDRLGGGAGDDYAKGGNGNDVLSGDEGKDYLNGGSGADEIYGGSGYDRILGADGDDKLYGQEGRDSIKAGRGADELSGGMGADYMLGQQDDDLLRGDEGNDRMFGGTGNDKLIGGDGRDSVRGDAGDDELIGGNGKDYMVGGAGKDLFRDWEDWDAADVFAFSTGDSGLTEATRDVIEGFDSGTDLIDLTGYGDIAWQSGANFSGGGAIEVRFDGDHVLIDANGDGTADEAIELKWVNWVSSSDFIL